MEPDHKCRVTKYKTFAWRSMCPDCGWERITGDWYRAMGDARYHRANPDDVCMDLYNWRRRVAR